MRGADHIMGHEAVGTIEAMGKNVRGFAIGDRVTGLMGNGFAEYTKINHRKIEYKDGLTQPVLILDFYYPPCIKH